MFKIFFMALIACVSVHACKITLGKYKEIDPKIRQRMLCALATTTFVDGFENNFDKVYARASVFEPEN